MCEAVDHFPVMWQTLYFNIWRVQRCNVHGRPIEFLASTLSALTVWVTNNGDAGGRYTPVNISYFFHKTDQPLDRGLVQQLFMVKLSELNVLCHSSCFFMDALVRLVMDVTGPVTEFLPDLKGATAAALCRLPLSSDGVIIMWAGMLVVEGKPT